MRCFKFSFVLFLFSVKMLSAQWIPVNGIDGGFCSNIIETEDSTLFLVCDGIGIVKLLNDDSIWTQVCEYSTYGLLNIGNTLLTQPNLLYPNEIYRSVDQGNNWETIPTGTLKDLSQIENDLFAWNVGTHYIVKSADLGNSWNNLLSTGEILFLKMFTDSFHIYYYDEENPCNLFIYNTINTSFDSIQLPGSISNGWPVFDIINCDSTLIIASDSLYFYTYVTHSWTSESNEFVLASFVKQNNLLFGCGEGIYKFNPNAAEWESCNSGLPTQKINKLFFGSDKVLCTGEYGVYKSDTSFEWKANNSGLHGANILSLSYINSDVWACTSIGLFKSVDKGINFEMVMEPDSGYFYKIILTDSAYYLVGEEKLLISKNQGSSWTTILLNFDPTVYAVSDIGLGNEYIFAVAWCQQNNVLYRTRYNPVVWEQVPGSAINLIYKIAVNGTTTLVSKFNSGNTQYPLFISYNNGEGLTPLFEITNLDRCTPEYENAKFHVICGNQIFISNDNAISWTTAMITVPDIKIKDVTETFSSLFIVANRSNITPRIFLTPDMGNTWTDITDNLSTYANGVLTHSSILLNRMFAGTSKGGLWYRDDLLTKLPKPMPKSANNLNILPNPNHGEFEIELHADYESSGILKVTDQNGKIIRKEPLVLHSGLNRIKYAMKNIDGLFFVELITDKNNRYSGKVLIIR